jgi:hypothetical protein
MYPFILIISVVSNLCGNNNVDFSVSPGKGLFRSECTTTLAS